MMEHENLHMIKSFPVVMLLVALSRRDFPRWCIQILVIGIPLAFHEKKVHILREY